MKEGVAPLSSEVIAVSVMAVFCIKWASDTGQKVYLLFPGVGVAHAYKKFRLSWEVVEIFSFQVQ